MMKKVSKLLLLFVVQAFVALNVFGQASDQLSGFSTPSGVQPAARCDQQLPAYGFGANGNWLVSTRNANFVGTGASVELANDFIIPNYNVSGQRVVAANFNSGNTPWTPEGYEVRYFTQAVGGGPGATLRTATGSIQRVGALVVDELPVSFNLVPGVKYWVSCVGVNSPTNTAVARWDWDGTPANATTLDPAYVRYQPGGAWGGAACAYWTPKASCAFLATSGPPNQAMNFNICRNAFLTLGGTPVPTMTQWGLFLFGLVLLTLAVVTVYNFSRKNVTITK
ncbi:MAG: hypothetical protein IPF46_12535 [Saprospiraceae bacterium]|nr:hypothetical protein [Candidatus Vicinibacter affinis]